MEQVSELSLERQKEDLEFRIKKHFSKTKIAFSFHISLQFVVFQNKKQQLGFIGQASSNVDRTEKERQRNRKRKKKRKRERERKRRRKRKREREREREKERERDDDQKENYYMLLLI